MYLWMKYFFIFCCLLANMSVCFYVWRPSTDCKWFFRMWWVFSDTSFVIFSYSHCIGVVVRFPLYTLRINSSVKHYVESNQISVGNGTCHTHTGKDNIKIDLHMFTYLLKYILYIILFIICIIIEIYIDKYVMFSDLYLIF